MKKVLTILIPALALGAVGYAENGGPGLGRPASVSVDVGNEVATNQNQSASASGGDSQSDSASNSVANVSLSTSSVSNYQSRTPPLTTFPPYLPYWTHGGWGTIKAYFPNGPTANDQIYETTFDPNNPTDMRELRSVLRALPHRGLLAAAGGILNDVAVVLFGKPDTYFHGRGLEIADSIVRDRRPEGKALLVFIDSNVDMNLLGEEGYAYMGKVSVEGDPDRNWDQAYKAAVAEALLWDVDILLISGGMKGVTTGTNVSFPSAAAGYSQVNYSLSLMGSKATGITEGKGKAILSAEAYRYSPQMLERRRIPAALYERIRVRSLPGPASEAVPAPVSEPVSAESERRVVAAIVASAPAAAPPASARRVASAVNPARVWTAAPSQRITPTRSSYQGPGVTMSQELLDLAGFPEDQQIGFVNVR
jgi:hypothetical protein